MQRFQNRVLSPGSAIDGKGKAGALDDSKIQSKPNQTEQEPNCKAAQQIMCENLCIKKFFEMQVKIKADFKSNSQIFD